MTESMLIGEAKCAAETANKVVSIAAAEYALPSVGVRKTEEGVRMKMIEVTMGGGTRAGSGQCR